MPTLQEIEKELGVKGRTVAGPYEGRRMGYPLHKEYYKKSLDLDKVRRRYKVTSIPFVGRIIALFF